ncbi:ATP-dependent nuclease [Aliarcobacter butzleri]|uniref:ATP-dependent nuclease n=1 Tax=Aliarcobacter butzleri TaxID=28197 RepID=UPI002B2468B1|nr:AAA family ATPase [Aliarcobacter butzleri]
MKLKSLRIKDFKNLTGTDGWFTLDFTNKDGITVLIGNNGSGKSNVLEAISSIFTGLYKLTSSERQPNFQYEIEYKLRDKNFKISNQEYRFEVDGNVITKEEFKGNQKDYLPYNVIASYSGEETRLWDRYYSYLHGDFKREINSDTTRIIPANKLLDVDGAYWNEALVSLLLSTAEDNKKFVKEQLKIDSINSISFEFNISKINKKKNEVSTNILLNFLNVLNPTTTQNVTKSLSDLQASFSSDYERDTFIKFTSCSDVGYIKNIKIKFNSILNTEDLSEGQKKQILIKAMLDFIANEHSLILLDEPDSHIHVVNKVQLKELLYLYKDSRDTILTTHSPSLTHAFDEKHITMIVDGEIEDRNKQEIFSHISDGIWNYQEQSVFLSSNKKIILLVEGKHDKIHIEEAYKRLKNNYSEIDFDIFNMHGVYNITNFMNGMKKSSDIFDNTKIYIGIFDYDQAGKEAIFNNPVKKKYASLKGNQNFYHMYLPFIRENEDFEIENMYPQNIIKDAYKKAIDELSSNINKLTIEDKAKTILSDNCHSFQDEDFDSFKKLFDLIKTIYFK